ncbi:MAG: hypothetical protein P8Q15_05785 [Methylophilaceae bacterium]|nr:hypothetical protein [Methylophilaceae bacterium]
MSDYSLNLNTLTFEAVSAIIEADAKLVGTKHYMGVAYFWGSNGCKHYLRDASTAQRRKIHKQWIDANLDLIGETLEHYAIIAKVMKVKVPTSKLDLAA